MDVHSLAAAHTPCTRPARMDAAAEQRYYRSHAGVRLPRMATAVTVAALGVLILLVGWAPA